MNFAGALKNLKVCTLIDFIIHGLKNDIRNLSSFHGTRQKSENLHFDGLLLPKAYKVSAKKILKSYLS